MYLQGLAALKARGDGVTYAIVALTAATELDPGYASAWSFLGFAYNQLDTDEYLGTETFDDYRQALIDRYVEKALALNPNDTTAHHLKANRLRQNDEWLEAEAEYMLAIESDSQSAAIYEDYAEFLFDVGRLEEALAVGRRSYELDPLTPLYITAYADPLLDTGDYAAAERFHSLALQQDDEYPNPHLGLLAVKLMQERYDEVLLQVSDPTWRWSRLGVFLTSLVDYWRKSGKWGDICRPRGEDDFECGVF